jgi:hypothetical protein
LQPPKRLKRQQKQREKTPLLPAFFLRFAPTFAMVFSLSLGAPFSPVGAVPKHKKSGISSRLFRPEIGILAKRNSG